MTKRYVFSDAVSIVSSVFFLISAIIFALSAGIFLIIFEKPYLFGNDGGRNSSPVG
jgi:hypothetical protein